MCENWSVPQIPLCTDLQIHYTTYLRHCENLDESTMAILYWVWASGLHFTFLLIIVTKRAVKKGRHRLVDRKHNRRFDVHHMDFIGIRNIQAYAKSYRNFKSSKTPIFPHRPPSHSFSCVKLFVHISLTPNALTQLKVAI